MRVPENIRKCVAFLAFEDQTNHSIVPVGSVFFLGHDPDEVTPLSSKMYAVTARHVLDKLRSQGVEEVIVVLNMTTGDQSRGLMQVPIDSWFIHPDDASLDVAIFETGIPNGADHLVLSFSLCIDEQKLDENEVDLGDEVFISGLFSHHIGQQRNVPIVRVGNLAALDEEKVQTREFGDIDAYLIEARSIGGLSGSPVFLNLGFVRSIGGQVKFYNKPDPMFFVLGLIHGHYDLLLPEIKARQVNHGGLELENINTGIAIVVPMHSIFECIKKYETMQ